MHSRINTLLSSLVLVSGLAIAMFPTNTKAQSYPIDCAILLCLSGGWPASAPCARARTEFIRRVTPWPIEPPLQIWRCPMGVSYAAPNSTNDVARFYDILSNGRDHRRDLPVISYASVPSENAVNNLAFGREGQIPSDFRLLLTQEGADIDISGPEFNFVRSIRVFDVFIDDDRDDDGCSRYARIRVGNYGVQGGFGWSRANRGDIPTAFGRTVSGCSLRARAVFVEWRDYEGNYGFERVDY